MNKKLKWLLGAFCAAFLLAMPMDAQAQNVSITGKVLDQQGQPIPGAAVMVQGASTGTITDFEGNFTINAPADATLNVSFIGYEKKSIQVSGRTSIEVTLNDEMTSLDEVVAVGYGNTVRRDLTGSVGSISGAKLAVAPVASAGEALAGKVAGVQVTTVDGAPGADINIRVRGGTSVTQSNQPLFIVDGFPTDNINDIPPTDIQSIDILKDASLTAIYGAKGGNGVVIVTTKGAQEGKIKIDFNMYHQVSMLANHIDVLDPYEFVYYATEAVDFKNPSESSTARRKWRLNWGSTYGQDGYPSDLELYKNLEGTKWEDEIMGSHPWSHMYNITMSGGNEKMKANVSITHNEQNGVIDGSGVIRTNLNAKLSIKFNDHIKLLINPRVTYRRDTGAGADNVGKGGIVSILQYKPVDGVRAFGRIPDEVQDDDEIYEAMQMNPLTQIDQYYRKKHAYSITNQASLEITPIKDLVIKSDIALFNTFSDDNQFYGYLSSKSSNQKPVLNNTNKRGNKLTWTNTISYSKTFNFLHNINVIIGQEIQQINSSQEKTVAKEFPQMTTAKQAIANISKASLISTSSSVETPDKTASFFGQISYNYDHKYLLSGTFRADGSTKFAQGKQWGNFPAASAAWVISREDFMDFDWLSNLKLRAAVGLSGNNNIDNDMWVYNYGTSKSNVVFGENGGKNTSGENYYSNASYTKNSNAKGTVMPNPSIKWETTLSRNIAVDLSLFDDKIEITPEFYWNTTKDLLLEADIPMTTGYKTQIQNIGQTTNKGIEISINYNIIQTTDARLDFNFNIGHNKNKIDKLNGAEYISTPEGAKWYSKYDSEAKSDYLCMVGKQVGLMYGFVYDGIYGIDDFDWISQSYVENIHPGVAYNQVLNDGDLQPGDIKFKDITGDGIVDVNDRTIIGNTTPRFQGGFGLSGSYKQFDMTMNFIYMLDFDVYNANAYTLTSDNGDWMTKGLYPRNILKDFDSNHRWRYINENGERKDRYSTFGDPQAYKEMNEGHNLWNPIRVGSNVMHSYFVEDGSFLRLQDLTIGYTFAKELTQKIKCQKARIYFTGSNLFCITKYSGYDPEVDIQSGLTPSMDYNRYPRSRGFLLGVNLTF
ncbi:MAG: TonB-dependent receptor [Marinilabiliaceae bacterium]|nr:TonB-dependent receptor [Marinilabiliaceae bacterium]